MALTKDDIFGLVKQGLDVEKARQEAKSSNAAGRAIAATQNVSTPTGIVPGAAPPAPIYKRQVGGVPIWALGLGLLGGGYAIYRTMKK